MEEQDKRQMNQTNGAAADPAASNKGKTFRVLSTSLGVVLAANLILAADVFGDQATPTPTPASSPADQPKLAEWSSDAVKAYFDASADWNIPLAADDNKAGTSTPTPAPAGSSAAGGGSAPIIVQNNGGFGWEQLLLYHMIFNSGRSYAPSSWNGTHPMTDYRTNRPYTPKSFDTETFRSQATANSSVRPKTSNSGGTFTTRSGLSSSISGSTKSSSSSQGGIGGRSSGFSSSTSSSSGSSSGG
jgi:hypothetical protein